MTEEAARLTENPDVIGELFVECQERLGRMVGFRLSRRLRGRVDVSDVLQEAFLTISRRADEYVKRPEVSFYVWSRQITFQVLLDVHRRHLSQKRDARQEIKLRRGPSFDDTSVSIVQALCGDVTSPSAAIIREEEIDQLREALESMDEIDREVLALRHFEHLNNTEVAETLGLSLTAASNRYIRAVGRLAEVMQLVRTQDE